MASPPRFITFEGYKFYGLNRGEHEGKAGLWYREWAPAAKVGYRPPHTPPHTHTYKWAPAAKVGQFPLLPPTRILALRESASYARCRS